MIYPMLLQGAFFIISALIPHFTITIQKHGINRSVLFDVPYFSIFLSSSRLLESETKELELTASQSLLFALIGDKVPMDDAHWQVYQAD